jgi:hypothetical protein
MCLGNVCMVFWLLLHATLSNSGGFSSAVFHVHSEQICCCCGKSFQATLNFTISFVPITKLHFGDAVGNAES